MKRFKKSLFRENDPGFSLDCLRYNTGSFFRNFFQVPEIIEFQETDIRDQGTESILQDFIPKNAQCPLSAAVIGIVKGHDFGSSGVPFG